MFTWIMRLHVVIHNIISNVALPVYCINAIKYHNMYSSALCTIWDFNLWQGSVSSELLMCGGVHHILLLPLVARCLEIIDVCIWEVWVFCHADVVCLYLVCILWQFSMLHSTCLAVCLCWSRMQEATVKLWIWEGPHRFLKLIKTNVRKGK